MRWKNNVFFHRTFYINFSLLFVFQVNFNKKFQKRPYFL
ncbi:hypothetical protein SC1083_1633 [Aggregatibacter actinomycetemcomitans serotype e str. SC1083]|uniref:Uncharacterized protein n=1 Tax=Aggregatibacter actinomycetemcomitans serotype e str. SC1083 TaxID=907488 RepID=G4A9W4_AGGAC|nr:hypothetical protein CF65_00233 [Aggregatibacter actinomycetemcomitans HK1651]EGY33076.1 hypothetical protein SC1083_1633 [Aggregatibacter actinomycetemcomitans serotype e str. SC1083]